MTLISKNFSEVITFSRGTGATRVNSAGLIVGVDFSATSNTIATGSKTFTITADANVNRDWPVGSNVIAVSQAGATGSMTGVVTSYTPSTQALVINVTSVTGSGTSTDWRIGSLEMREDYDPVTLVRKGVLSEVSATNEFLRSNEISSGYWTKAPSAQIIKDTQVGYFGSLVEKLAANTSVTDGAVGISRAFTLAAGQPHTYSFIAKTDGSVRWIQVYVQPNNGVGYVFFDLIDGLVGNRSGGTASITPLGRGFFKIIYSFTAGLSTSNDFSIRLSNVNGAGGFATVTLTAGQGVYIEALQKELSDVATSTIPTTTTQVTRNADNFPLTASALTSIRQGEGTLYAEIDCPDTGVAQKRALRLSGTNADIRIGKQGTGTLSNFTKMAEGAGLRLMGTATSLIRGNGQELLPVTAIDQRTGLTTAIPAVNAVAFDGSNLFALGSGTEETYIDGLLGTYSIKGSGLNSINIAHYNGNRFIAAHSLAGVVFVSDGTSYRRINTPIITQPTSEITSGLVGGTLRNVIVGNNGFIATSDDNGENWTARTSGTTETINCASFGSVGGTNYFIVAGNAGQLRYSTNAITYTNATGQSGSASYFDVHVANNIAVAVGNAGAVFVSTNGTTFTAATATNTANTLIGVTYSPTLNLWIAVGSTGTIITATNPAGTWTVQTSGTTQTLHEIGIFNNAIYIVGNSQTLLTSSNGTSYTSLNAGVTANLFGIAASPTTLLITGSAGAMASSTDGTTFTSRTNNGQALNGIAFGNNVFVSTGNAPNGSGYIATIGADGTVTRRVSNTADQTLGVRFFRGAHYVFANASTIVRSTDQVTWTKTTVGGVGFSIYDMADSGTLQIAVGSGGRYTTSTDGTTFAASALNGQTTQQLNGIDYFGGNYVAVGNAGVILTTTNGTTWTLRTSGTTQNLNSVMFSTRDNLWYAAGNGGTLLYAVDPTGTWTAVQNSGTASILGTTLQSNQPLPQFKSGVNKIALSYKSNQVISALNGVASTTDTTATIPSITAGTIGENFNGTIQKIEVLDSALTNSEIIEKTL